MRALLLLALSTTGCSQIFGLDEPVSGTRDGGLADGPADSVDGKVIDALACYGSGLYSICFNEPPTGSVALAGTINTDTDARCVAQATDACVIAAGDITVETVKALGTRPFVLVASGQIKVVSLLDAGSRFLYAGSIPTAEEQGAGASLATACSTSEAGANQVATTGAGGGAGGSFRGRGGSGGRGGGLASQAAAGSEIGLPTTLQGGCPGGDGGSAGPNSKGLGGRGGGAVYLIASVVTLEGTITVGGAGGTGGIAAQGGAGGGGSGGFIGIDAPTIACSSGDAYVRANGGGGGEGGGISTSTGNPGESGADTIDQAAGGSGANQYGGDGGDGAINSQTGQPGQTGNSSGGDGGGGGGGGGGTGFIKVYGGGSLSGCSTSPPPL